MENKFFEELSRRLREGGIESSNVEDKRLEVFLHGRPVLFVSPGHDAFLLPAGSQNQKASELYHRVAGMADEVYEYVEAVQNAPLLRASSLKDEFHLLADFGGAVLAGIELPKEWGYQFNTWIWNYDRTALLYSDGVFPSVLFVYEHRRAGRWAYRFSCGPPRCGLPSARPPACVPCHRRTVFVSPFSPPVPPGGRCVLLPLAQRSRARLPPTLLPCPTPA